MYCSLEFKFIIFRATPTASSFSASIQEIGWRSVGIGVWSSLTGMIRRDPSLSSLANALANSASTHLLFAAFSDQTTTMVSTAARAVLTSDGIRSPGLISHSSSHTSPPTSRSCAASFLTNSLSLLLWERNICIVTVCHSSRRGHGRYTSQRMKHARMQRSLIAVSCVSRCSSCGRRGLDDEVACREPSASPRPRKELAGDRAPGATGPDDVRCPRARCQDGHGQVLRHGRRERGHAARSSVRCQLAIRPDAVR